MIAAVAAGGGDDDWRIVALAENFGRHVDLADVDQPARAELEFQKALAVGAQRDVVVDAGGHIAEMRRRHVLVHHRFEIEHVERLLGTRNQVVVVARRPDERIGRTLRNRLRRERRKAAAGEQRACGEKLNEAATAGRPIDDRRHDGPPPRVFCDVSYRAGAAMETGAIALRASKLPSFAVDLRERSPCKTASQQSRSSASAKPAKP